MRKHEGSLISLLVPVVIMTAGSGLYILMAYLSLSPYGSTIYGWINPYVLLCLWIAALVSYGVCARTLTGTRRIMSWILVPFVIAGASAALVGSVKIGSRARMSNLHRVMRNAQPLIQAIRRYESEKGHPPAGLQQLIPNYLLQIPETGVLSYPDFDYETDSAVRDASTSEPWTLAVSTPSGSINFDHFAIIQVVSTPMKGGVDGWSASAFGHMCTNKACANIVRVGPLHTG